MNRTIPLLAVGILALTVLPLVADDGEADTAHHYVVWFYDSNGNYLTKSTYYEGDILDYRYSGPSYPYWCVVGSDDYMTKDDKVDRDLILRGSDTKPPGSGGGFEIPWTTIGLVVAVALAIGSVLYVASKVEN